MEQIKRNDPIVWVEKLYKPLGIIDRRIPFKVYDISFSGNQYEKFKHFSGRVVDLGCGKAPFPWANILIELDPFGNSDHGYSYAVPGINKNTLKFANGYKTYFLADGRILYVLDVTKQRLPFTDAYIDYIYACHILEHLENPKFALSEIKRVARAGCIRYPRISSELLYHDGIGKNNDHKWIIESIDNVLTFRKMTGEEREFVEWRKKVDDKKVNPTHFSIEITKKYNELKKNYSYKETNEFFWDDNFNFKIID